MVRDHEVRRRSEATRAATPAASAGVDPAMQLQRTLGNQGVLRRSEVVQRDGEGSPAPGAVHSLARAGVRGRGGRLPHLDAIQRSFGAHDVSGVAAHTDGGARRAARGMRARAFTVGEHVAFDGAPDLHTAAHEAAHVVQQRRGVDVPDGVGRRGDRHEVHAEAIADRVVDGRSVEAELGAATRPQAHAPAVQCAASEQALIDDGKALRAPDALNTDTQLTLTQQQLATEVAFSKAEGTLAVTKGTRIRIVGEDDAKTTIKFFRWNNELGGWDQFEGTVPNAAITKGSTEQQALTDEDLIVPKRVDDVDQADVFQAGLSDCYFQAALISVASMRPQAILDMIEDDGNEVHVRFFYKTLFGAKTAEIPVKRTLFMDADGELVYHGKRGQFLWPAFINKAWAVFKGGWSAAQMGHASDAMFAITGQDSSMQPLFPLETGVLGVAEPTKAFSTYERIRDNVNANKPVALGTGSFAKSGLKALNNANKDHGSWANRAQPVGKVRNLHQYAILDITPKDLKKSDFKHWVPGIDVTLRDPRDAEGALFTRTIRDILTAGKFEAFYYEE